MKTKTTLQTILVLTLLAAWSTAVPSTQADTGSPKRNVIILISDGAGFNAFAAASMYEGRWDDGTGRGAQVYDGPEWKRLASQTHPLNTSRKPRGTGEQDPALIYDPAKAWDRENGYGWLCANYTDSAAAATALSTGRKTYNSAINWSDLGEPIAPTMSELAKSLGLAAGVVTSVQWAHATPAGFSNAHVPERDEYQEIAQQILKGGVMDVVMGAGNPDFDNDGNPWQSRKGSKREYKYVGGQETWEAIEAARAQPGGLYQGYRPVSAKAEFEALCSGKAPAKVLGTAQAATTLQQARSRKGKADVPPGDDTPLNPNVPTLATMAKGALNVLSQHPNGFFLMIEGGAVDWANHANLGGRMIQEQSDFNRAVEAVVEWVETASRWEETLVVITSDHETGLIWGPGSDQEAFQPLANHGAGRMPGLRYHSKNHSNSLVPVFARGAGANRLDELVVGTDPVRGPYVDSTGIAQALQAALRDASRQEAGAQ